MAERPLVFPTTYIPQQESNPFPSEENVPDILRKLYNPLWQYFAQREIPDGLSVNSFEAAQDWVRAYGLDKVEEQDILEDNLGTLHFTSENYLIDINPFQPHPAHIVIGRYTKEDQPVGYFAFAIDFSQQNVIRGIISRKLPDEDVWIGGELTRHLDEDEDISDTLQLMVANELLDAQEATHVLLTYCFVDPIDPPSPGGGEELLLPEETSLRRAA